MTTENPEQEPITIVDKRKIDPSEFEGRSAGSAPQGEGAESGADGAAAPAPAGTESGNGEALADAIAAELAERTADLQRLTAEYANYRRRVERDRKAAIDSAKSGVVSELLGVLDDLDRARAHGDLESGPLKSVADKLADALTKQGLQEFGTEGEPFDPTLHEAVQHEGEGHNPVIGVVMRKGYRFGDRVLRHALVGVTDGTGDPVETPDAPNVGDDADGIA
ncbi:nucleotide exchange factor GrpE [Nocardia blacklockiae]|uniref:nucleotide exchange factor GrpE n=1 Tax=Nocardia blacklockiae TaxID=480036 RepID=UPI0018938A1B|nr:nucleotide exchange factor GrpE [Nocardia blacklockiae]MBF6175485.1 nucleotide exchange factor GrpE [Nocardia blacklockiae]